MHPRHIAPRGVSRLFHNCKGHWFNIFGVFISSHFSCPSVLLQDTELIQTKLLRGNLDRWLSKLPEPAHSLLNILHEVFLYCYTATKLRFSNVPDIIQIDVVVCNQNQRNKNRSILYVYPFRFWWHCQRAIQWSRKPNTPWRTVSLNSHRRRAVICFYMFVRSSSARQTRVPLRQLSP